MKNILITLLLIIPVIVTGCSKTSAKIVKETDTSVAVEVADIEKKLLIDDYDVAGKLYASEEVAVSSKVNGKIKDIKFNVGENVKKGDVLYTLDNEDLLNDVSLQKSKLTKNLDDAKIRYDEALENYNDLKSLYESGAVSSKDLDSAQNVYDTAKLSFEQAKRELNSNSISLDSNINDTIIKSPIDGIIASRNIEVGEMTTNADFTIVKIDTIIGKTNVTEDIVNRISVGDKIKVNVQSKDYEGTITTISPVGINNGNVYPVEIEIENNDLLLKPGMFANIYFEVERIEDQIIIPKKSIISKGNQDYVYIIEEDKPKKVIVETGIIKDGYVQVSGQLSTGDKLVVKGQEYINEESTIKITNQASLNE